LSEHDVSVNGTISELDDETGELYDEKDLNSVADTTFEASNSAAAAQDETKSRQENKNGKQMWKCERCNVTGN